MNRVQGILGKRAALSLTAAVMIVSTYVLIACSSSESTDPLLLYLEALRGTDGGYSLSPPVPGTESGMVDETHYGLRLLSSELDKDQIAGHVEFTNLLKDVDGCFMTSLGGRAPSFPRLMSSAWALETLQILGATIHVDEIETCIAAADGEYPDVATHLLWATRMRRAAGLAISSEDRDALLGLVDAAPDDFAGAAAWAGVSRATGLCPQSDAELETATRQLESAINDQNMLLIRLWTDAWATLSSCEEGAEPQPPENVSQLYALALDHPDGLQLASALAGLGLPGFAVEKARDIARAREFPTGGFALVWPSTENLNSTYQAVLIREAKNDRTLGSDELLRTYVRSKVEEFGDREADVRTIYQLSVLYGLVWNPSGDSEPRSTLSDAALSALEANSDRPFGSLLAFGALEALRAQVSPEVLNDVSAAVFNPTLCATGSPAAALVMELASTYIGSPSMSCHAGDLLPDADPQDAYVHFIVKAESAAAGAEAMEVFGDYASDFGGVSASRSERTPSLPATCAKVQTEAGTSSTAPSAAGSGPDLAMGICLF